ARAGRALGAVRCCDGSQLRPLTPRAARRSLRDGGRSGSRPPNGRGGHPARWVALRRLTVTRASRGTRRGTMPLYLSRFSYTPETWARMIGNPEDRQKAARSYIESVGGTLHGFWYAF